MRTTEIMTGYAHCLSTNIWPTEKIRRPEKLHRNRLIFAYFVNKKTGKNVICHKLPLSQ
jgi:hypothetical protein